VFVCVRYSCVYIYKCMTFAQILTDSVVPNRMRYELLCCLYFVCFVCSVCCVCCVCYVLCAVCVVCVCVRYDVRVYIYTCV